MHVRIKSFFHHDTHTYTHIQEQFFWKELNGAQKFPATSKLVTPRRDSGCPGPQRGIFVLGGFEDGTPADGCCVYALRLYELLI